MSAAVLCALLAPLAGAHAAQGYDPTSTPAAPCGQGTPPPGHILPEVRVTTHGVTLTVRQDGSRLCYVANGTAEAPVLRVRAGSDLRITLRNEISDPAAIDAVSGPAKLTTANAPVPDSPEFYQVIPGMRHHATGATNLHVHGFPVPPVKPQDDVLSVCTDPASGTQRCGQRAFSYRYHLPAEMGEGLYWYHPHMHGEVQAQMLMGLSGAIIVEGPADDARRAAGIAEHVLIVRQTQDLDAGKTAAAAMTAAPAGSPAAADRTALPAANAVDTAHELLCASGAGIDAISLNGTPVPLGDAPDAALGHIEVAAGGIELIRLLNAATDAFLDLTLLDASGVALPLQIVARDGSPLRDDGGAAIPAAATTQSQAVPPAGRLEFLLPPLPPGAKAYLVTHAVDTGCAGDRVPERRLVVIDSSPVAAGGAAPPPAAPVPPQRREFFSGLLARPAADRRVIALAEYPRPGGEDQTDFYIFERRPGAVLRPYGMDDAPGITVRAGSSEEWLIENWTHELHAFHIHQVHFRVLEVDGQPLAQPPLLDVVTVPYATATGYHSTEGPVRPGRVLIKVSFPPVLGGDIPFHCHLADHEDNGMMAVLRVLPAAVARPAPH